MNQILYLEKEKRRTSIDINKIVKFFGIALIVFGVLIAGQGIYGVARNADYSQKIASATPVLSVDRDGQYLIIKVSHIRPIESIKYNWNDDDDEVIDGNNRKNITEKIELPGGNNTFNIVVTDTTQKETTYSKDFSIDTGRDIQKPKIELNITGNYAKLTITDETKLSYVTYRWNDDEEKRIEPTGAENAKIEGSIEILKGKNTLTIIAVDSSNNTTKREETFEGRVKPTVEVYADGDSFLIIGRHEKAIDRIEYTLNGQKYRVQFTAGPEMQYRQKIQEGYNHISVQVYSVDNTVASYEGEYTYTPAR